MLTYTQKQVAYLPHLPYNSNLFSLLNALGDVQMFYHK